VLRQVNASYSESYERLMQSGLYAELVERQLLVSHREVRGEAPDDPGVHVVLEPEMIPFVSYPYEWCHRQLKAAALATLEIQRLALDFGMTLKDASAFNIQFLRGKPVLIDTLSFAPYNSEPWVAYRQFCQHFLAPLSLMSYCDTRLGKLLGVHIDGIPLDLASRLLPSRTRARFGLLSHIHLHAASETRPVGRKPGGGSTKVLSKNSLMALIESLRHCVRKLSWDGKRTVWSSYSRDDSYSAPGAESKAATVERFLDLTAPTSVWDLGGNTGFFSRLACKRGAETVCWDGDYGAIENNYRRVVESEESNLLPLVQDLSNPSGRLGWALEERESIVERGPVDLIMALALVHHLRITLGVPLERIVGFLSSICRHLILEFVPKSDRQVVEMLAAREDVFDDYSEAGLQRALDGRFRVLETSPVGDSDRQLYLLERVDS
jgi:hypothetical protein